ncbi:hypothetical protein RFI_35153, partial [Reticulomyxa filosa]
NQRFYIYKKKINYAKDFESEKKEEKYGILEEWKQAVKKAKTKQEKQQEIRLRLVRLLESKKSDLTSQWLAETRDEFDINYKMDHKTLLHEICSNDNSSFYLFLPVVVSMFSNEIDWTLTDANGKTPLLCAKEKQNQVVLEYLLILMLMFLETKIKWMNWINI